MVYRHCILKQDNKGFIVEQVGACNVSGHQDGSLDVVLFNSPAALVVSASADVYIVDTNNNCVRKLSAADGRVVTIAGHPTRPGLIDGDGVDTAAFYQPTSIAIVEHGPVVLVADNNNFVRAIHANGSVVTLSQGSCMQLKELREANSSLIRRIVDCQLDQLDLQSNQEQRPRCMHSCAPDHPRTQPKDMLELTVPDWISHGINPFYMQAALPDEHNGE
eukprot:GHVS01059756.1.p1 GENE.GHVS01059756.1~~GHVS01059756.1.p1  ORF type:complete len:219 (-),score=27.99 GHVS01059756.1:4-660(-)